MTPELEKAIKTVQESLNNTLITLDEYSTKEENEMFNAIVKILNYTKKHSGYSAKYEPEYTECLTCKAKVHIDYAYNGHMRYHCEKCGTSIIE